MDYSKSLNQLLSSRKYHKPIGSGIARKAYYSPTFDLVFKVEKEKNSHQNLKEISFIQQLTAEEKDIFPVVDVITYKHQKIIVMKRVTLYTKHSFATEYRDSPEEIFDYLTWYCEINHIQVSNIPEVVNFIKKYRIFNVHQENVGIYNGKLVLIDIGY